MAQENNFHIEDFDPEVLREYDIRGVVDKTITENIMVSQHRIFKRLPGFLKQARKAKLVKRDKEDIYKINIDKVNLFTY